MKDKNVFIYPSFRRLGVAKGLLHYIEQVIKPEDLLSSGLGVKSSIEYSHLQRFYL